MMNYNPYFDISNYTGKTELNPAIPKETLFSCKPYETIVYKHHGHPSMEKFHSVIFPNLTKLDKTIIGLVTSCQFMTGKQIDECLILLEIEGYTKELHLKSLRKLEISGVFRSFIILLDGDSRTIHRIYTLHPFLRDEIPELLNIPATERTMMYPPFIKRVLAQNQVMLAFLKSDLKLDWLKRDTVISVKGMNATPSLGFCIGNQAMLLEVIRHEEYWESKLEGKLLCYKAMFDDFEENSWDLPEKPILILNGEDESHNHQISEIAEKIGIEVCISEDILFCDALFKYFMCQFDAEGDRQFIPVQQ